MGMILFVRFTSFLLFVFRNLLHEESNLCQPFQNHPRLFGRDGSTRPFFEDPLGASNELGGECWHGGDIYVDFGRIKKPRFCVVFLVTKLFQNRLISLYFPYIFGFSLWRLSFCTLRYSMSGFRGFFRSTVCTPCIVQDFSYP